MKEINYTKREAKDFTFAKRLFQIWSIYCIMWPFLKIFYKAEVRGRENVPEDRKFVCAINHISYFDPFIAAWATKKSLAYMAKKELFDHPMMALTMDFLAAFAVNREKLEVSTIRTVKEIHKTKNWILGIFPQGGIRRNRKIEYINKGFAAIAKASKVDILPVAISGCEEDNWIPLKGKVIVEIGKPISYNQEIEEIIEQWGKEVAKMAGYEYAPVKEAKDLVAIK